MKIALKITSVGVGTLLCLTTLALGKDDLPTAPKFSRYDAMLKRSPFAVASAAAPTGGSPDFAKNLYVANAAHSTDGDFVTLASTTDKDFKEYLNTKETVNGFALSTIEWSDQVGETKVTISKDGQFATLTFNEALLSQSIQNPVSRAPVAPPQPQGNVRPVGTPPATIQRPMQVPQIPTPPPHVRSVIRRKGNTQQVIRSDQQVQPQDDTLSADDGDLDNP